MMDTIFAEATAPGRAGLSVIRLSGPRALAVARDVAGSVPGDRRAGLRDIRDSDGTVIDRGLVICFAAPNSFTGEDVVEFHLHGSIAVVRATLRRLGHFGGVRQAEAGEFTRRALENDRLDLAQVEGLADLIEAETEVQRRQALRTLSGELGERVDIWRRDLIRAAALLEATIDFADEEVPLDVTPEVRELLERVQADLEQQIIGTGAAERIRSGFEVAILGAPNAGKSTLLNRLAGRDAAITSEVAGTTRDVIEVRMDLRGLPVTILDTAGLRQTTDLVEAIGVKRALARAGDADLRVFLQEPGDDLGIAPQPEDIVLRPKADLLEDIENAVSGLTGSGVDSLVARIADILQERSRGAGLATHERHRLAGLTALEYLSRVFTLLEQGPDVYDLVAAELHGVIRSLEQLVGRVDVENLLDEIFSSFCVGK